MSLVIVIVGSEIFSPETKRRLNYIATTASATKGVPDAFSRVNHHNYGIPQNEFPAALLATKASYPMALSQKRSPRRAPESKLWLRTTKRKSPVCTDATKAIPLLSSPPPSSRLRLPTAGLHRRYYGHAVPGVLHRRTCAFPLMSTAIYGSVPRRREPQGPAGLTGSMSLLTIYRGVRGQNHSMG